MGALEVINTSMDNKEMADYTLGLVKQIILHRSRLLDKSSHLPEPHSPSPSLENKLTELATYTISIAKQARARSSSRYRSVSRARSIVTRGESYRDQSVMRKMARTEDRMMRGYF